MPATGTAAPMAFTPLDVPAGQKDFGHVSVYSSTVVSTTMPVGVICAANAVRRARPSIRRHWHRASMHGGDCIPKVRPADCRRCL